MRSALTFTIVAMFALVIAGCMPAIDSDLSSLADRQPKVVEVNPLDGAETADDAQVKVVFSLPIEPMSLDSTSFAVIPKSDGDLPREIADKLDSGEIEAREGSYSLSEDGKEVTFAASEPYDGGVEYFIVITNNLVSKDLIPFNQTPGLSPTPFVSAFKTTLGGSIADVSSGDGTGSSGASGGDGGSSSAPSPKVRPSWLVINELLYDVVGADTNGDVFVELAGETSTEISGYKIAFVNGSDGKIYDTIDIPEASFVSARGLFLIADAVTGSPGTSHVEDANLIVNFDPQNGPDAVQLLDDSGKLIDALGYGSPMLATAENGMQCYEGTPAITASSGASISRVDAQDTGDNSKDFVKLTTPTPGN